MVHAAWDTMRDREFVREPYVAVEVWIDLQTKFVISQTKFLVLQTNFVCMTDHKLENMRQASPGDRSKAKHWESCVAYGGGRVWMRSRRNVEILGVDGL